MYLIELGLRWHRLTHVQGKDTKDESGRFSALSSCDSPRQDDIDDADYPFAVDDVDTPSSQPGYVW
jgi:autophagy-related protein 13